MLLFNDQGGIISLQHCYFNTSNVTIQQHYYCNALMTKQNFNTSNVTIQPQVFHHLARRQINFNTSNVTIQQCYQVKITHLLRDFNTSNVTIQLEYRNTIFIPFCISIHLMLLFNRTGNLFNISYCFISIHLMLLFNYLSR